MFEKTVYNDATLHVPAESVNAYKSAKGWKSFNVFFSYPAMLLGEYIFLNSNVLIKNAILLIIVILFLFEIKSCPFDCFKIWLCITWQCLIYYLIFGPSFQKAVPVVSCCQEQQGGRQMKLISWNVNGLRACFGKGSPKTENPSA